MPKAPEETPEHLRPFIFLGLDMQHKKNAVNAYGPCMYCNRDDKFSVKVATSEFRCLSCDESGNVYSFIKDLWQESFDSTSDDSYAEFAKQRGIKDPDTLKQWQLCRSSLTGEWLVPGYGMERKLGTLYRYAQTPKKKLLLACPYIGHKLHGLNMLEDQQVIYLCEGIWDSMVLWECFNRCSITDHGFESMVHYDNRVLASAAVVGFAGALTFKPAWCEFFEGKTVYLMAQNDHERTNEKTGKKIPPASFTGMKRIAGMLPTEDVHMVEWGEGGFDDSFDHGFDMRDVINDPSF